MTSLTSLTSKWLLAFWLTYDVTPFPDVWIFDTQADCYMAMNIAVRSSGNRAVCAEIKAITEIGDK